MVDKFSLYDALPFEWLKLRIPFAGPIVDVVVVVVVVVVVLVRKSQSKQSSISSFIFL